MPSQYKYGRCCRNTYVLPEHRLPALAIIVLVKLTLDHLQAPLLQLVHLLLVGEVEVLARWVNERGRVAGLVVECQLSCCSRLNSEGWWGLGDMLVRIPVEDGAFLGDRLVLARVLSEKSESYWWRQYSYLLLQHGERLVQLFEAHAGSSRRRWDRGRRERQAASYFHRRHCQRCQSYSLAR